MLMCFGLSAARRTRGSLEKGRVLDGKKEKEKWEDGVEKSHADKRKTQQRFT